MMDDDNMRAAFATVVLGIEAEKFNNSDIGKYLLARAEIERERAINEFKVCDISDLQKVRKLQDDINIPDKFIAWLAEAIDEGYAKHDQLREAEQSRAEQQALS